MDSTNQLATIAPEVKDLELTATLPNEMITAQQELITWCDNKLASLKIESSELKEAYEIAVDRQWNSIALKKQYAKSVKSLSYYEKVRAALNAGYYIVPNFNIDLFAIRTNRSDPKDQRLSYWNTHEQDAQELPAELGEYKNPFPLVRRRTLKDNEGKEHKWSQVEGWDDIDFPITMAKPMIMQATSRAMALKIFDRIGIVPHQKKEDPVIIGQVMIKEGSRTKRVSFMIAWHLNTNVI